MTEDGKLTKLAEFDEPCSGIGFLSDGTLLVSLMSTSRVVCVGGDGTVKPHADLTSLGGTHVNDMISDSFGRCYVDLLSYGVTWAQPEDLGDGARRIPFVIDRTTDAGDDRIALVNADGSARVVAEGLLGPNGLAVTPEGDRLVVAEWRAGRISEFVVDPSDGSLSSYRVLVEAGTGRVDGLCLDEEGAVWCASPATGEAIRYDRSGAVIGRARSLAGNHVMACVLGGHDRRTLYLMSNRRPDPTTGMVEAVRVDVPGSGQP
jgi:sugar lactone lactonase YvrE